VHEGPIRYDNAKYVVCKHAKESNNAFYYKELSSFAKDLFNTEKSKPPMPGMKNESSCFTFSNVWIK